jgi:cAMP-dependent protein kinase regulator
LQKGADGGDLQALLTEEVKESPAPPVKDEVALPAAQTEPEVEEEEEEDDVEDELDEPPPEKKAGGPRSSVSAEAYGAWNVKKAFEAPNYPKTDEQKGRIKDVLSKSFLFMSVDPENFIVLLGAVQEVKCAAKERIIKKGEDGDFMCIIESGTFKCYVPIDGEDKCVKTCEPGDVFGELALMYNCPRAASVEADTEGTCWKLDRETFNAIVRDAAQKKREKWEAFLKKVPILEKMDDYMRSQLTDALKEESYEDGKVIMTEGEEGNTFYILAEGAASAKKGDSTMDYSGGDFFGELALLKDQPRAATVTSKGCKVLALDRKSFNRLLDKSILSAKAYE